ncbi:unnamed protein product [Paramecium pentaurelia]|uniref:Uncharacterized protein n=1 Tax=Paramecium pentaurelia TaxID=43138 RepID=A0A8S1WCF6_9CILI|nr:unnamed protein product [Paramecium pentaurelia]
MGSLDIIPFINENQEKKEQKFVIQQTDTYLNFILKSVYLNLEKLHSQISNAFLFKKLTNKIEIINNNSILMRDISNSTLSLYEISNNIIKLNQTQSNLFAFEQNQEKQIRFFSVTIINQECRIQIELCDFVVIVFTNNQTQYYNNQSDFVQLQVFINLYDVILEQLKYENNEWILNLQNNDYSFYKKVDKYPDFFYLNPKETLIFQCSNSNVKIHYNS